MLDCVSGVKTPLEAKRIVQDGLGSAYCAFHSPGEGRLQASGSPPAHLPADCEEAARAPTSGDVPVAGNSSPSPSRTYRASTGRWSSDLAWIIRPTLRLGTRSHRVPRVDSRARRGRRSPPDTGSAARCPGGGCRAVPRPGGLVLDRIVGTVDTELLRINALGYAAIPLAGLAELD